MLHIDNKRLENVFVENNYSELIMCDILSFYRFECQTTNIFFNKEKKHIDRHKLFTKYQYSYITYLPSVWTLLLTAHKTTFNTNMFYK